MSDLDPTIGRKTATDRREHVRIAIDFFTHHKHDHVVDPVERAAVHALHGHSVTMAKRTGSDGHIRPEQALAEMDLPAEFGKILIADAAWHQDDHGCPRCPQPRQGHVYVHDYLDHNRSAAQDAEIVEKRRRNGAEGGKSRWAGHTPKAQPAEKRPPGRPRKHPIVAPPVAVHPAQARAEGKKKPGRPAKVYDPVVHELCQLLATRVRENGYAVGTIGANWLVPCEQLLRRGYPNSTEPLSEEQIRKAILWATDDHFWYKNIRSMANLRKHYERLRDDAKDASRAKRGQDGAVRRHGSVAPPAAVSVPGMTGMLARQLAARQGGMVKGGN